MTVAMNSSEPASIADELQQLEARINALLPPRYVGCFEDVAPTSMGSATLRYDSQGRIAWGEIWTTFCHLALAGGPPHRGRWLGAVTAGEVAASPAEYAAVVAELQRAIRLTIELPISSVSRPGWIGVECPDGAMAAWLTRAITAENVVARREGELLFVPAGPSFVVEKEIKNVVVSLAKSCHYLLDHVELEDRPSGPGPNLIGPPLPEEIEDSREAYAAAGAELKARIQSSATLPILEAEAPGWLGLNCETEEAAVWMLRAVAVEDVLVRREESRLYVPICLDRSNPTVIETTADAVTNAWRLWNSKSAGA